MKKMFILAIGWIMIASCSKTYVCKNDSGVEVGEVKASSQKNANSRCPNGCTAYAK
jgi:hypothetical protein